MQVETTPIEGLVIVRPDVYKDERGFFLETYSVSRYSDYGIKAAFVQDNLSCSGYGVVRGLHFQLPPFEQAKLVSCPVGKVWDVAVDLRKSSPTYKKWFGVELSEENHLQFFIPRGFAHGFVALSQKTIFTYKCDNVYNSVSDGGISILDAELNIQWPIDKKDMIISEKDKSHPYLQSFNNPF